MLTVEGKLGRRYKFHSLLMKKKNTYIYIKYLNDLNIIFAI